MYVELQTILQFTELQILPIDFFIKIAYNNIIKTVCNWCG